MKVSSYCAGSAKTSPASPSPGPGRSVNCPPAPPLATASTTTAPAPPARAPPRAGVSPRCTPRSASPRRGACPPRARTRRVLPAFPARGSPELQRAARGGNRAHARLAFGKGGKEIKLALGRAAVGLISAGKVADDVHRLTHIFALAEAGVEGFRFVRVYAKAMHTGVELHPDIHRRAQGGGFQGFKLFDAVDHRMQLMFSHQR